MDVQKKFFLLLGGGTPALILLALGCHYLATHGRATESVQGKLLRRLDGSPVVGATLYASETPVLVLSRPPGAREAVILGGTQAQPSPPVGRSAADGSFGVDVPATPGASLLAVDQELAAVLFRASALREPPAPASVLVETPCSLQGEVYDRSGSALENTFISLVPYGAKEKPRWQTWTDASGSFRFDRLPVGRLTVSVLFPRSADTINTEYSASAVVGVSAGKPSFIHFGPSGSLLGKVRNAEDKPMPNAEVMVRSTGFSAEGRLAAHLRTKAAGDYRLFALPPTAFRAFIRNPDPEDEPRWLDAGPLDMPRSGERWADLKLKANLVRVRVAPESKVDHPFPQTLPKQKRPPLKRLLFFPSGSSQASYDLTQEMKISSDGRRGGYEPQFDLFNLRYVPPGTYTVAAQVEGYGGGVEEKFEVKDQDSTPILALTVWRGGPVVVRVVDPAGASIPHAIVSIWLEGELEVVRGAPDEELAPGPGNFVLRVEADGYKTRSEPFHILVAESKRLTITLEPEKDK